MRRSINLPLIALVLLTAIALAYTLRDLAAPAGVGGDTRPTVVALQPTTQPLPTSTPAPPTSTPTPPTNTPTPLPTVTPTTMPATATPLPPSPTVLATEAVPTIETGADVVAYTGYSVREGDTLASIAQAAGSTPELIASYNKLVGEPQPGRALIIPQLQPQDSPNAPLLVRRGQNKEPVVALTLDAGGSAESAEVVLQALRERNIHITFFLTGKWMRENPELTRQIVADGHEIANHSVTHRDLTKLDDDAIRAELTETEAILHEIAGSTVNIRPFFRPPYGAYNDRVLQIIQSEGYVPIYWTLDSLDSVGEPKTAEFLVERVTAKRSPEELRGAIILAHCGFAWTAEALPIILDRFTEMGFEVKKLSEVL